jgi:hypothetical protein
MDDVLRQRLWRHIEALPEEQAYQVLDYIEFLSSKYHRHGIRPAASPLQSFGEKLQDKMRLHGVATRAMRGTLGVVSTADRVFNGIADAGRTIVREVESGLRPEETRESDDRPRLPPARPDSRREEPPST